MALMCNKPLFLKLLIKNSKSINSLLGPCYQCFLPIINYSQSGENETEVYQQKLNKAMKAYLEKAKKYDEFLKEQLNEYELGKKFLAGMMGEKKEMTQKEVDKAIEFLFPSGLFNKHARPKFKPPEEIFEKRKPAQFDNSGRPFHFLFYTNKPNYSQLLHDAAKKLCELQLYEQKMRKAGIVKPEKTLTLAGQDWLSLQELQKKLLEKLQPLEYERFVELFTRLIEHPFSYIAQDFIKNYKRTLDSKKKKSVPVALHDKNGIMHVTTQSSRKTSRCTVKVSYPGSGKIRINNTGLDYFLSKLAREQVLFPLLFTGMEDKVDVTANPRNGGEISQAGSVRYGIAQGLRNFVSEEMLAKMKLAGLLQKDFRQRERKKVGREGARRGYTWLKR